MKQTSDTLCKDCKDADRQRRVDAVFEDLEKARKDGDGKRVALLEKILVCFGMVDYEV